jgi:hypothetical protein
MNKVRGTIWRSGARSSLPSSMTFFSFREVRKHRISKERNRVKYLPKLSPKVRCRPNI